MGYFYPCLVWVFAAVVSSCLAMEVLRENGSNCLSWRLAVETGNLRAWPTVPVQCILPVQAYMLGGQYHRDIRTVVDLAYTYIRSIVPVADDGMDAWLLDVDDTCLSNLLYYSGKQFGGDPYDRTQFEAWSRRRLCTAIPEILGLFTTLIEEGFKVILLTGRDEETLMFPTVGNLHFQGFIGYERLIMRGPAYRGRSSSIFKSEIRKQLVKEGYRIRGNVGDQWSDLAGDSPGDRIFKIPNPMYFVP